MLFSCLTMNPQPLHIDRHFAAKTEWGQPLMNSLFTLGLMIGISVNDLTVGTIVANLGMTDVKFPAPLFQGDTIHVETLVASKRESKSRPDAGIVEFEHKAFKQDGTLVAAMPPPGLHAQEAGLIHALAAFRSRRQREEDPEGARLAAPISSFSISRIPSLPPPSLRRARLPPKCCAQIATGASMCASMRSTPA